MKSRIVGRQPGTARRVFLGVQNQTMSGFSSLSQMILALRGRWKLAALVAACVAVAICIIAAFLPPQFTATAWIVFNNRGSDAIIDKNDSLAFAAYVNAEVDLIGSRRVMQRAVASPGFINDPRTLLQRDKYQKGKAPLQDWLVNQIGRNLNVVSAKGTRTVSIGVGSDDPVWAAQVANLVAQAYLDTAVELKVTAARRNVAFFKAQVATRADDLARVQANLNAFLKTTGMTGLEGETDTNAIELRALSERLTASQARKAGTQAESSLGGIDAAISAGTVSNVVVQQLGAAVATQSAVLRDLNVHSGPNHPAVIQGKARLAELQAQLVAELGKVARGIERQNQSVGRETAQIEELGVGKRQLLTATAADRARLQVLTGEVNRAKANYDAVAARLADVELQSDLEAPSAAILSAATPPRGASFPNWLLVLALALVTGAVSGVLAALIREMLAPRVRSWSDLEALLGGAPVLCDLTA
ncbi:Wzz/FepE/Etk N-terminal domain-containing protein [Sandarakinorhabdus sp.]|uniref:GumC family protein n=1 Tax=Sandarakinorhabdus sp. TaxID=1916663 RepID=UPI00286DCFB6|nr:Wzz/FepE/Etk N-terminal domain-containing protein [Sandarakinorhabdus sp.]